MVKISGTFIDTSYLSIDLSIFAFCLSTLAIMSVQVLLSFDACNTEHAVQEYLIHLITQFKTPYMNLTRTSNKNINVQHVAEFRQKLTFLCALLRKNESSYWFLTD